MSAKIWKSIWFASVPGKVRVHLWRVCSSILPTVLALQSRQVYLENGYYFCNSKVEPVDHISRDCCFVRDFINFFPELRSVMHFNTISLTLLEWLQNCAESLSKPHLIGSTIDCSLVGLEGVE